jgi:parvulin-like peptidyl-prolyl isomerase
MYSMILQATMCRRFTIGAGLISAMLLAGCGGSDTQPLSAQEFYSTSSASSTPLGPTDQPGVLQPRGPYQNYAPPTDAGPARPSGGISPGVYQTFAQPTTRSALSAITQPSTLPSTLPSALSSAEPILASTQSSSSTAVLPADQYMTLGTVVAVVNGTPIFANKVLRRDATVLRELAKDYDIQRFEEAARDRIDKTTDELVYDELEYAAAERELDKNDKQLAEMLTEKWRQRQITEAGGSLELARRRAAAEGEDFDDRVDDQHRFLMILLYRTRKIDPRVQVTAEEMRQYYRSHLDSQFTKLDKATVWIINADPADLGDDVALAKINDDLRRIKGGEDFVQLAQAQNSTVFSQEQTIERHSFVLQNVENAIWAMQPGQVSAVIKDRGGYYLIKVDTLDRGGVQSFEDEAVQDLIRAKLRSQQLQKLQDEEMQKLRESAIVRSDPSMIDAAVEMALQNYPKWSKE